MSLTGAQKEAIAARGNVLVVAGAGTGKTTTMVERCLDCLTSQSSPVSLEELLLVTFTEAAATEMRQRIRTRLIQESEQNRDQAHWQEQLALFETAHIGTLHSFCFKLIRQHFYQLELDPQVAVLPEEEARLQADEVLEDLFQRHYAGQHKNAAAVQQLIQAQGRGGDDPIRKLVLRLHNYTQTLPNPSNWLDAQLAIYAAPDPVLWKQWRVKAILDWCKDRLPIMVDMAVANPVAARCVPLLKNLQGASSEQERAQILQQLIAEEAQCPSGRREVLLGRLKGFFKDARFLASLAASEATDPLAEDWTWVRSQMMTVLELVQEFTAAFSEAKRELGLLDFHDLEQYALRLLWNSQTNAPTSIAKEWRHKFKFVFVDEYQDINAAQDKILEMLSREGAAANRFLVGDAKQSIYRFRLADPYIFRGYVETWGKGGGTAVSLVENFRSREAVLNFINSFFAQIMRPELGGTAYDQQTQLRFGAPEERFGLSAAASGEPCVELHLWPKPKIDSADTDEQEAEIPSELVELEDAEKEARLVALRLLQLKSEQRQVWDETSNHFRPVEWRDIALLLRAPANKAETYAKEFARLNIPLQVERRGFYRSLEILDVVSLLQILDNPLQDIPLLAVLRSPLVGLKVDDLAIIRLALPKGHFWQAIGRCLESRRSPERSSGFDRKSESGPQPGISSGHAEHGSKNTQQLLDFSDRPCSEFPTQLVRTIATFIEQHKRWRRLARLVSLSRCLEMILVETHYREWLLTQSHGEQRHANVQRLLALAERFDQFQRQGLFRFLRFIETQQAAETEPEVPAIGEEDAVRLMSIHQSKGLEFPVVALADLGKPFNRSDLIADIILDEQYGVCPQIKPPHTGQRYPSLPYWMARRRQNQELLSEELRLLYVGMTRARDFLILTASVAEARLGSNWSAKREQNLETLKGAQSYADWLGFWFAQNSAADSLSTRAGQTGWLRWFRHDHSSLRGDPAGAMQKSDLEDQAFESDSKTLNQLLHRLAWQYPWDLAAQQPAKTSVSAVRRRAMLAEEAAVSTTWSRVSGGRNSRLAQRSATQKPKLSAREIGDAHHTFLQLVELEQTGSPANLQREAERLCAEGALTAEELAVLNLQKLAVFWNSDIGRQICSNAAFVRRELAFTARFSPNELARFTGDPQESQLEREFVVVQGIVDLAAILESEIWVLDFKTDEMKANEVEGKVKLYQPQLSLYAQALSRIYKRPVSQCWIYFLSLGQVVTIP
jgi:ATP-dependent helicase/nuclease subunit A